MPEPIMSSYDELPYSCHPVLLTHPDNLACKALLHGLRSPAVETCRVLELGCGTGGNLIPLAQIIPTATFVGIDYAHRQILQGQAIADMVGLSNLRLKAMSLAEVDEELGEFDYILCHGVYSWVSDENQRHILRIISQHLAPNGVAYVSYNTFPGWHLRGLIREILCYQTKGVGDPAEQVSRARKYLDFLIQSTPDPKGIYAEILRREREILSRTPDTYVFHEHLEERNKPIYFHEFAKSASEHRLQFLSEASFPVDESNFTEELRTQLNETARDRIDYEQQLDFLCNGTFRRSLLCHADVALAGQPSTMAIRQLKIASRARPARPIAEIQSAEAEEFLGPEGESITTTFPLIKAALLCLSEASPQSLTLEELHLRANAKLGSSPDPIQKLHEAELLSKAILRCHKTDLIQLHLFEPCAIHEVSDHPVASGLSRWQAAHHEPISNLRHRMVELNNFERFILSLLDGTLDREGLCQAAFHHVASGQMDLQHHGKVVEDKSLIKVVVEQSLLETLHKLAAFSLLIR